MKQYKLVFVKEFQWKYCPDKQHYGLYRDSEYISDTIADKMKHELAYMESLINIYAKQGWAPDGALSIISAGYIQRLVKICDAEGNNDQVLTTDQS